MTGKTLFTLNYPTVAVAGSDARFPVHRIYCNGQNYAAHAREMGHDPEREPSAAVLPGDTITGGVDGVDEIRIDIAQD